MKLLIGAIVLFAAATGYLQIERWKLADKQLQVAEEVDALQKQNDAQLAKNKALKAQLGEIKNNPDVVFEELAREKLFMVQPDEQYVLPQSEAQ